MQRVGVGVKGGVGHGDGNGGVGEVRDPTTGEVFSWEEVKKVYIS